jgi:hypothetical protein
MELPHAGCTLAMIAVLTLMRCWGVRMAHWSHTIAQPLRIMCRRSWTDQYLVYEYGTWVVWLLELIWCQLFLALGLPAAQLRRQSGMLRGAFQKACCGWRLTRKSSPAAAAGEPAILPVTVAPLAQPAAADAAGKDAKQSADDKQTTEAAQALQQPAGQLAKMNLSDALSGQTHCFRCRGISACLHVPTLSQLYMCVKSVASDA